MKDRNYRTRTLLQRSLLAGVGAALLTGGANATLTTDLIGYYNLDGNLNNSAVAIGGTGGAASMSYAGSGSSTFLVADAVPDTTSFFPAAFGGVAGDAIYLGGDTADLDHYTIPGLTLGSSSFTVNLWAAMGEDQSASNSGNETTGGNGPSIFGNVATGFEASGGQVVQGGGQGFSYGVWSSDGDDYAAYTSDGTNGGAFGDQDVSFDNYFMHTLVYDAGVQQVRRYQNGFLQDTLDVSGFAGDLDSGNDLRIGGYPVGSTSGSDTYWGAIDEIAVWDGVVAPGDIATLGANGLAGFTLANVVNGTGLAGVAIDTFTGAAGGNNNLSNDANWDSGPSQWGGITSIFIADGTSGVDPAVFDAAFGSKEITLLTVGADGQSTDVLVVSGAELTTTGSSNAVIGVGNSTVNLTMTGGSINHTGGAEEGSELNLAKGGSTVNLTMSGDAELLSGNYEIDASYATGFRRPLSTDSQARHGDDMDLGNGGDVTIVMDDDALMYTPDVLYPSDSGSGSLTVTQNGNSKVVANWDTRFFDTSAAEDTTRFITWTLNDNAQFLVARDHGLGEAGGPGTITININDNALFYAGGRIAAGAGFSGDVVINQTGGRLQAGSAVGSPGTGGDLTVDGTGIDSTSVVRDGVLWMGEGANSVVYNLSGGSADITRTAFVGADGAATINQTGGTFTIYGNGSIGDVDGNDTVGIPIDTWTDGGGDLFLGRIEGDNGTYNISGGTLSVARDIRIGFDSSDGTVVGGDGALNISGTANVDVASVLAVGGDGNGTLSVEGSSATIDTQFLTLGGVNGTESGSATLKAVITGATHSAINATGGTFIQNNASLEAKLGDNGFRPTNGTTYTLVSHSSVGGDAGTFTGITPREVDGVEWSFSVTNSFITITADTVYLPGDTDFDGDVDDADLGTAFANYTGPLTGGAGRNFADGDNDGDGDVDDADLGAAFAAYTGPLANASVPEPTSLALLTLGGLLVARRRRSA